MVHIFNTSKAFARSSQERLHTSSQAPKGPIDGVCDEVCNRSAPRQKRRRRPAWREEGGYHVCAQSVTYVYAPCREGEPGNHLSSKRFRISGKRMADEFVDTTALVLAFSPRLRFASTRPRRDFAKADQGFNVSTFQLFSFSP